MKVLFIDKVHSILQTRLEKERIECIDGTAFSKNDCLNILPEINGIVIRSRFRLDQDFLQTGKNLQFIARSGAGMENIDDVFCEKHQIKLFNAPEGNRNAVGEHAVGMILTLFNRLHIADQEIRKGKWDRELNRGIELEGKTIGIIGYGNNGAAFAEKLSGFDVTILAYDKYRKGFDSGSIIESSIDDIFSQADIVSFHIPQNEETTYYADENFFSSFKKNIYLINLSRGKIVQTSALVEAIKNEKVLGACLDVLEYEKSSFESFFEQELDPNFSYLLTSEKVLLSPHVGGWTQESYFKLSNVLADKILAK